MAQSSQTPEEKAYEDLARVEFRAVMLNAAKATLGKPTCQMRWSRLAETLECKADGMVINLAKPAPFLDELTGDTREGMVGASVEDLERKRDCLRHTMTVQLMMVYFADLPATALHVATTRNEYFDAKAKGKDIDLFLYINTRILNEVRLELAKRGKSWEPETKLT